MALLEGKASSQTRSLREEKHEVSGVHQRRLLLKSTQSTEPELGSISCPVAGISQDKLAITELRILAADDI